MSPDPMTIIRPVRLGRTRSDWGDRLVAAVACAVGLWAVLEAVLVVLRP